MKMPVLFPSQIRNGQLPNGNLAITCPSYHALFHECAKMLSSERPFLRPEPHQKIDTNGLAESHRLFEIRFVHMHNGSCTTNVILRQLLSRPAPQSSVFDIDEIMQFTCCFEAVMRFRISRTYTCEKPDYVFLLMGGCNVDCAYKLPYLLHPNIFHDTLRPSYLAAFSQNGSSTHVLCTFTSARNDSRIDIHYAKGGRSNWS